MSVAFNKRDANEAEIIERVRACGWAFIQHARESGYDGDIVTPFEIYMIEVKNPAHKWELTAAEKKIHKIVEAAGNKIYIIISFDDFLRQTGLDD